MPVIHLVKMVSLSLSSLDASVQLFLPVKYLLELTHLSVKFNFIWLPCKEPLAIMCAVLCSWDQILRVMLRCFPGRALLGAQ